MHRVGSIIVDVIVGVFVNESLDANKFNIEDNSPL
jgi:hypothetical protein